MEDKRTKVIEQVKKLDHEKLLKVRDYLDKIENEEWKERFKLLKSDTHDTRQLQ